MDHLYQSQEHSKDHVLLIKKQNQGKTMKTLLKLSILLISSTGMLMGQSFQKTWDKSFGNGGKETFHQILQSTNGLLLAVGETSNQTVGGKDGLLTIIDYSNGNEIYKKPIGSKKDDALKGIVQTYDGHFILVGNTEGKGQGKKDAWVVKADQKGNIIWDKVFGTPENDSWEAVSINDLGEITLTGMSGESVWIAKLEGDKIINEKKIGKGVFESVKGMANTSENGIVIAGNTRKSKKRPSGDLWVSKFDKENNLVWERFFGEKGWDEATGIIATKDGGYLVSGLTKSKGEGGLDMWVIKISREGYQQWDKTFGGKDEDIATSIAELSDGGLLIAGTTKSHRSGARQPKGFVVRTDAGGYRQWQQEYGGDKEDYIATVNTLYDGSVILGGNSDSQSGRGKCWVLGLQDPTNDANYLSGLKQVAKLKIDNIKLVTDDGVLRPQDVTYLTAEVTNSTTIPMRNVKVQVDQLSGTGLDIWNTNMVGALAPNESKTIRIPVKGNESLATDIHKLNLNLLSGNTTLGNGTTEIQSKKPVPAKLEIAAFRFDESKNTDEITLKVSIENIGDFPTKIVDVDFEIPPGFKLKSGQKAQMGAFLPRSKKETELVFTAQGATPDKANFICVVKEGGSEKIRKTLEMTKGGSPLADGPLMIWTDPAPHELGTNRINRSEDFIEFKMTVVSGTPLDPNDFKLAVNDNEMEGSKFNEEELSPPVKKGQQYTYTYKNKVKLKRGSNNLQVVVGEKFSAPIDVVFEPKRANLHILAIGPSHPDLNYTGKDANDFASAFKDQGGASKLYSNVYVNKFDLPETTTLTSIQQALYDLVYQYKDQLITPNDVVMVFISSHGKVAENRFKILQSNYNPKYGQIAVDFKKDIIESLNQIDCKKLVFLDACHSGAAKSKSSLSGLSQAVVDLAEAQSGISTLTSCRSNELSYEDEKWQNGAFTEAMLEAFAGKEVTDANGTYKADANDDQIIRLGELYDYLQARVPSLVKGQLPSAPTAQVPFMPEEQLDRNLPIYFIEK